MTTMTPTGSRQARAAATRQRILDAARELFVNDGYRSTSLRDIAAAASVSHPGLLGHFASKDDLLAEVVAGFEEDNERAFDLISAASEPGSLIFTDVAERNATVPGYLELFAALTGEASASDHPAHDRMRDRYARLREMSTEVMDEAITHGTVDADRDPEGETTRMMAGWDGLQLISQYLPDRVDVVTMLEEREALWAMPYGWSDSKEGPVSDADAGEVPPTFMGVVEAGSGVDAAGPVAPGSEAEPGYASGRRRRARIVADAMRLFSRGGYGDTSLRDIAEAVGVSKSTLLHHYPSKELLLSAVLSERDRAIQDRVDSELPTRAAQALRGLPTGALQSALDEPGLIEVYAVLSCEAVPAGHPAHDYFTRRFDQAIDYFAELFRVAQADGDLPPHRDPEHEAIWLVAMWDGLQYQWLYDRDAVDVAAQLQAHLDDVLPAR